MQQNGYPGRRRSLLDDARFEAKLNRDSRDEGKVYAIQKQEAGTAGFILFFCSLSRPSCCVVSEDLLPEEEVFVTGGSESGPVNVHLILGLRDDLDSLVHSLKSIKVEFLFDWFITLHVLRFYQSIADRVAKGSYCTWNRARLPTKRANSTSSSN